MKGYSVAKATHAFLVEEVFAASEPPVLNCRIKFRRPWPPTSHKHWPFPWSLMSMFFPPPALTLFFSAVTGFCEYYRTCTMCCRRLRLHHNEIHAILKSFVRGCSPDSFWLSSHELHWLTVPSNPKFLSPVVLCFDYRAYLTQKRPESVSGLWSQLQDRAATFRSKRRCPLEND